MDFFVLMLAIPLLSGAGDAAEMEDGVKGSELRQHAVSQKSLEPVFT